ncbi:unnamed protein product [Oikopleura dioica]|uniref:Uncharacterized protein n=1 Tax=Oikopleura dioica TaxID=34765 RepID=E4Y935_OIKDI|nr:unnamed protein product [Oikopleura dioica]
MNRIYKIGSKFSSRRFLASSFSFLSKEKFNSTKLAELAKRKRLAQSRQAPKPDIKETQLSMQMQIKGYKIFIAMFAFGVIHALNLWEFKILIQTEEELIRLGVIPPFSEPQAEEDS